MQQEARWYFDGLGRNSGEDNIISGFLLGAAQTMSLAVYNTFMTYKGGVLSSISGPQLGAHAVAGLGYGVDQGTKYWLIQNSWGLSWGENGCARIQRGINLMGIDGFAVIMKAYVDGGTLLPCLDGANAGVTNSAGVLLTCQKAARWCSEATVGATVTENCPVTCKKKGCDDTRRSPTGYVPSGSSP